MYVIPSNQYGCKENGGVIQILLLIYKTITSTINDNNICYILKTDVAKAYDTVNRDQVTEDLKHMGVYGKPLKLRDYFTNRKMLLHNDNEHIIEWKNGIIQGSTISTTLYNAFSSLLCKLNLQSVLLSYIDDNVLIQVSNRDKQQPAYKCISSAYNSVEEWYKERNMVLNNTIKEILLFSKTHDNNWYPL